MLRLELLHKYIIKGKIIAKSGLHIGGTESGLSIGGVNSAVIVHPLTREPYIPGSSIKGKMRSLIELRDGTIGNEKTGAVLYGPTNNPRHLAAKLFGMAISKGNNKDKQRPSRIIVRDAELSESSIERFDKNYTEVKTEVVIDRITAKAMPRQLERVPAGAEFNLSIVLNVFNYQDGEHAPMRPEGDFIKDVLGGLLLLQDDYLGGNGSRGSGQVSIFIDEIKKKTAENYRVGGSGVDVKEDFTESFEDLFVK
ncbi:MAG: type III-A CRISPR-associated RAMP protein Csm3 [Saprospiraceae bacterium]